MSLEPQEHFESTHEPLCSRAPGFPVPPPPHSPAHDRVSFILKCFDLGVTPCGGPWPLGFAARFWLSPQKIFEHGGAASPLAFPPLHILESRMQASMSSGARPAGSAQLRNKVAFAGTSGKRLWKSNFHQKFLSFSFFVFLFLSFSLLFSS